jgi:hypothetical protein
MIWVTTRGAIAMVTDELALDVVAQASHHEAVRAPFSPFGHSSSSISVFVAVSCPFPAVAVHLAAHVRRWRCRFAASKNCFQYVALSSGALNYGIGTLSASACVAHRRSSVAGLSTKLDRAIIVGGRERTRGRLVLGVTSVPIGHRSAPDLIAARRRSANARSIACSLAAE